MDAQTVTILPSTECQGEIFPFFPSKSFTRARSVSDPVLAHMSAISLSITRAYCFGTGQVFWPCLRVTLANLRDSSQPRIHGTIREATSGSSKKPEQAAPGLERNPVRKPCTVKRTMNVQLRRKRRLACRPRKGGVLVPHENKTQHPQVVDFSRMTQDLVMNHSSLGVRQSAPHVSIDYLDQNW